MSRYLRHNVFGERLVLAHLAGDGDAVDIVAAEIGDCVHCWRAVAELLAECAANALEETVGLDKAIAHAEGCIASDLDWLDRWAGR